MALLGRGPGLEKPRRKPVPDIWTVPSADGPGTLPQSCGEMSCLGSFAEAAALFTVISEGEKEMVSAFYFELSSHCVAQTCLDLISSLSCLSYLYRCESPHREPPDSFNCPSHLPLPNLKSGFSILKTGSALEN